MFSRVRPFHPVRPTNARIFAPSVWCSVMLLVYQIEQVCSDWFIDVINLDALCVAGVDFGLFEPLWTVNVLEDTIEFK